MAKKKRLNAESIVINNNLIVNDIEDDITNDVIDTEVSEDQEVVEKEEPEKVEEGNVSDDTTTEEGQDGSIDGEEVDSKNESIDEDMLVIPDYELDTDFGVDPEHRFKFMVKDLDEIVDTVKSFGKCQVKIEELAIITGSRDSKSNTKRILSKDSTFYFDRVHTTQNGNVYVSWSATIGMRNYALIKESITGESPVILVEY